MWQRELGDGGLWEGFEILRASRDLPVMKTKSQKCSQIRRLPSAPRSLLGDIQQRPFNCARLLGRRALIGSHSLAIFIFRIRDARFFFVKTTTSSQDGGLILWQVSVLPSFLLIKGMTSKHAASHKSAN